MHAVDVYQADFEKQCCRLALNGVRRNVRIVETI